MEQYIPKSALVAEMKKLDALYQTSKDLSGDLFIQGLFSFLNTLEVKKVDFEKEVDNEWNKCNPVDEGMGCEFATIDIEQFYFITKYFFELGLNTQKEKPTWNKEDESMYIRTIGILGKCYMGDLPTKVEEELDWLKSLKERYPWKPSKEQIMALRWVLNHIPYDSHKEEINGLLEQLIKLYKYEENR